VCNVRELSVILPLHNKEHSIKNTVKTLTSADLVDELQIIIVENESTDGSLIVAKSLIEEMGEEIDIMLLTSSKGKGNAIRKGIPYVKYDWCLITGADLPFGLTDIQYFFETSKEKDLYLGSKGHSKSVISRKLTRRVYSHFFYLIRKIFLKMDILDPHGSMIARSSYLKKVKKTLTQEEFLIDTEIVFRFSKLNCKIQEIPISLVNDDRTSTVKPLRDGFRMLKETVKLSINDKLN
jgi:glycosyltransferase involved in cell wall biosynthesis